MPSAPEEYLKDLKKIVQLALEEDIGSGDITAQLVPANQEMSAHVITRESAVMCGIDWFNEVFNQLDPNISIEWLVNDGDSVNAGQTIVELNGNSRKLLTGERTALNFLQTLMGTATLAHDYAKITKDSSLKILDTRKTIPGLRLAQKYAVSIGGCNNHRIGLYDAFLIKENHIKACGSISKSIENARSIDPSKLVEIEIENIDELEQAISSGADIIMLDNFDDEMLNEAIKLKNNSVIYELSGNLEKSAIEKYKSKGIDYLSSGALTKHCKAIDLSMRFYD